MAFYNDDIIEDIKLKADIVSIIGEFLPLRKRGRNFLANCPFHNEKTPSFTVSPDKQIYHCFGCNASGNVFTFLMEHEHMTFAEALKYVGDKVGVEVRPPEKGGYGRHRNEEQDVKRERLQAIHQFVARYFYKKLYDEYGREALAYAKNRALSQETLEKFKIGYAPYKSDDLVAQLLKLGYAEEELIESGIFNKSVEGRMYSKFFNRLIFPIENVQGKIIGFGGRALGDGEPKYLNSPETPIFRKKYNLYGLFAARDEIRRKNQVLVMEGYMDVISVWQKGVHNAVASLGTAFTEEQGKLLLRFASEIVLVYDNDNAGRQAALRALEILRPLKAEVRIAEFQDAKDPDEFILKFGLQAFLERIRNAKSAFRHVLDLNKKLFDYSRPEEKVKCIRAVLPEVMSVGDPLLKNEYLNILCEELGIDRQELDEILFRKQSLPAEGEREAVQPPKKEGKEINLHLPEDKAEFNVLKILVNQLELVPLVREGDWLEAFGNDLIRRTIGTLLAYGEEDPSLDDLMDSVGEDKVRNLIAYLAVQEGVPKMSGEDFLLYLKQVRRLWYRNRIDDVVKRINSAEKEGNRQLSVELQREWNLYKTELSRL